LARRLEFCVELPDDVSDEALDVARYRAKEAAILGLQQEGEISIREAAFQLGLNYTQYLDLLAAKGLPASSADSDPDAIEALRQRLRLQRVPGS
jgi:hypothetical protein